MTHIVNMRDVGTTLRDIDPHSSFPEGILYRGGRPFLEIPPDQLDVMNNIKTMIGLRPQAMNNTFNACAKRIPYQDSFQVYDTTQKPVRKWVNLVLEPHPCPPTALLHPLHIREGQNRRHHRGNPQFMPYSALAHRGQNIWSAMVTLTLDASTWPLMALAMWKLTSKKYGPWPH